MGSDPELLLPLWRTVGFKLRKAALLILIFAPVCPCFFPFMSVGPFTRPTVLTISLLCKVFLNSPFCAVTVNGLPNLLNALNDKERTFGRGVVTGMLCRTLVVDQQELNNHISL